MLFNFYVLKKTPKKRKLKKNSTKRYRENDNNIFYYDKFTNLKDIFSWIFKIEDTFVNIPEDKHVECM